MRYFLIYIILITVTNSITAGSITLADTLFRQHRYEEAGIEYERQAYKAVTNIDFDKALLHKANCYKLLKNYSEAEKTLSRFVYTDINDTLFAEGRFQSAFCSYLTGNYKNAESQIIQARQEITNNQLLINSEFLYIFLLNEQTKWKECKQHIGFMIATYSLPQSVKDSLQKISDKFYSEKSIPKLKSTTKAENISMFLPGVGHMYSGHWKEGLWSGTLNASAIALTTYLIYKKYYFSAASVGPFAFQFFYAGGIKRSILLAEKKNFERKTEFNNKVKQAVFAIGYL